MTMTDSRAAEVLAAMRDEGSCVDDADWTAAIDRAVSALSTQAAGGGEVAEAHCATCSCVPGMTPAVRFNTTPAEQEGAVRDHLIRMGWTPPAEAQAQGGGEVVAEVKEVDVYEQHGRGWHKDARILPTGHMPDVGTKFYAAPPSAPVGVDLSKLQRHSWSSRGWEPDPKGPLVQFKDIEALAQKPAAVDWPGSYPLWQAIHAASAKTGHPCNVGLAQVVEALDALATRHPEPTT